MRKAIVPIPESGSAQLGSVENENQEEEILERLASALKELPDRQRQVFELRYYQELSYEEISECFH